MTLTVLKVPHRDEFSDTHGFLIEQSRARPLNQPSHAASLLFLPDIDQWTKWERQLADFLHPGAHLLLDGTFYSGAELPHRDLSEIPHPLVSLSMNALEQLPQLQASSADWQFEIGFIHLNHSNPLWNSASSQAVDLRSRGFFIAEEGQEFQLSSPRH